MRRLVLGAFAFIFAAMVVSSAGQAGSRIALLIGNEAYSSDIGRLSNPHNDIAVLEKALRSLDFDVSTVHDAGLAALYQAVNAYARRVRAAGPDAVAFFYYSGHGASDASTNYLIPVDVKSAEDGDLWDQSLRLTEVTRKLKSEAGNATHFVVFDACRNTLKLKKPGTRALVQSKGFVPVSQESGMLVAYSTAEGELASDVGSGAGPYAKVLAEEIVKPAIEAVTMFRRVQVRVRSSIGQEPWLGFSALAEVYLGGVEPSKPPAPAASSAPQQANVKSPQKQAAVAPPQTPTGGSVTPGLIYSPWVKICQKGNEANARQVCITGKDGRAESGIVLVSAALVEQEADANKVLRVVVPLGMQSQPGTRIIIDNEQPLMQSYTGCFSNGCIADYPLTPALLGSLRKGHTLSVQAIKLDGQVATLPLPLPGFAQAYDGPPTDAKAYEEQQRKQLEELQRRADEARPKSE